MVDSVGQVRYNSALQAIDQAMLTPIVQRALGSETSEILDWSYSQVHGGAGEVGDTLSGIYRFAGSGIDEGKTTSWSLILKIIGSITGNDDPSEPRYWKREFLAYRSGRLDDLPGGLAAPRCYDVVERSDREAWLWLEDITDEIGPKWPLKHYGLAARHLGQFNGTYLHDTLLPSWPWLSQGWLRALVDRAEPSLNQLRNSGDHPLVRRLYPDDHAKRIFALWEEREIFLDALDRLPQTVCHHDAFRRNLFGRHMTDGREQTVAVDWAYVGIGAIGVEISPLVQASLGFSEVELAEAKDLEDNVFNGYLAGLADAGWENDPRLVRYGYTAASALAFGIGYSFVASLLDESTYAWVEQAFGKPIEQLTDLMARFYQYLFDLADEARGLLGDLDGLKG